MPNRLANSLASTKRPPRRIGFFAPAEVEFVQRMVEGVLRFQADRGGCIIRDFRFGPVATEDRESWTTRPQPWRDWQPDGLIVNISLDAGFPEWVTATGCPVINTNPYLAEIPSVYVSTEDVARVAIKHFRDLGAAHIAYVTTFEPDRRIPILRRLLRRSPDRFSVTLLGHNPSHWNSHLEAEAAADPNLVRLLANSPKPLAVMSLNDDVGRVVCLAADRLGLNVPREVAVLGIMNTVGSRISRPPLSSIDFPCEGIGYTAMEMLWRILDDKPGPDRVELPAGKLVVRESTSVGDTREADMVRARQVIRDRACEGVSIEQIISELNVSRSTLQRDFAAAFGHAPGEEITQVRMERAKELLQTTNLPITRIAEMVGYSNPSSFARSFHNHTTLTPRHFRIASGDRLTNCV